EHVALVVDHQHPGVRAGLRHVLGVGGGHASSFTTSGSHSRTVVPRSTSLSRWMVPPWAWTNFWVIDRPRPVPLPGALVVKKGSNTWGRFGAAIPAPVSRTSISTPGWSCSLVRGRAATVTVPPGRVA